MEIIIPPTPQNNALDVFETFDAARSRSFFYLQKLHRSVVNDVRTILGIPKIAGMIDPEYTGNQIFFEVSA
jgi:hypothetical protein